MSQSQPLAPARPPISTAATGVEHQTTNTSAHAIVSTDRIFVTCPHCAAILSIRRSYIGDSVRCKKCSQRLFVPAMQGDPAIAVYDGSARDTSTEPHRSDVDETRRRPDSMHASLLTQLAQFIASHDELRSDHDRLRADHDGIRDERDAMRATRRTMAEELAALRAALGAIAPDEVQSIAAARESLGAEVLALRTENQRLLADQSDSHRLTAQLEAQARDLGALCTELETSRAALCSSERARHEEVERLTAELTSLRQQHEVLFEQHQSAGSLFASLQAHNEELSAAQEQLAAEYQMQVESEKLKRTELASELVQLRAESEEMARLAQQWISAAMLVPTVPVASAEELEANEAPFEALGLGIAESEYLERLAAETLEKSTGRADRGRDSRGSTEPATLGQT